MTEDPYALARYLGETGTTATWLADKIGVHVDTVKRWTWGTSAMTEKNRAKLRRVLEERAALDLDAVLFDQLRRGSPSPDPGPGTPFDQALKS